MKNLMTLKTLLLLSLSVIFLISLTGQAQALILINGLNMEYSGGTAPSGPTPWITATFIDVGTNQVQLNMTAGNLTGSENIKGWYFNFDDTLDLTSDLTSLNIAVANISAVDSVTVTKDKNNVKADGDGKYDFMFAFPTSGNKFTSGETVVYDLTYTGTGTMNISSFNFMSSPAGGHGPFYSAAHIQNTGVLGDKSGWIANETTTVVPEPISSTLFIVGGVVLGFRRYRKMKKA
jgi:hypothetical protein